MVRKLGSRRAKRGERIRTMLNAWGRIKYGASLGALACAATGLATEVHAGGFAIREQSAYYQGMSFAGAGTGDTLSGMYWNSAAAAAAPGMNSESHVSLILIDSEITASDGVAVDLGLDTKSGDLSDPALVPASYANYQINDRLYLGLAINSGFGLVTKPDNEDWAGSILAVTSDVFSININPTLAYKLTPELTVGVGVQVEYLNVRLRNGPGPSLPVGRSAELDDIGVGATAGVTWTPQKGTTLGIGYRSAVEFDLEGDYSAPGALVAPGTRVNIVGDADASLTLPEIVTIGFRQALSEKLDVLVGYEWTNWSRAGSIPVNVEGFGAPETLRLNYDDGHFVSLGLEYDYSPATTFRVGVAWEKSPISDEERNVLLPDSDRIWVSVGASHKFSEKISVDLGYTHIFADEAPICRSVNAGGPCAAGVPDLLVAEGDASVNIISASFKYKWGGAEPELEPLK
jgi:long-chain fatty acid transport protein